MRQIWITRAGPPEVLQVKEAQDPEPKAGEVRVRAEYSGINYADLSARIGIYPDAPKIPCVVGYEIAGTVDAVGEGVADVKPGGRVGAMTRFGGYSDVVCVPRERVFPLPEGVDTRTAAAIPVNYLTAWIMLVHLGNVKQGEKVLVHSAGGGVGIAALQISKHFGAEVIGTASAGKHERLKQMGVSHCIDYRTQDFLTEVRRITGGRGVDIVLDAVGGKSLKKSYRVLAPLGRMFAFGASSFTPKTSRDLVAIAKGFLAMPRFNPFSLMDKNRGVFGVNMGHLWDETDVLTGAMERILALTAAGTFAPVVDEVFSFADAPKAHQYIHDRKNFGKVLLAP